MSFGVGDCARARDRGGDEVVAVVFGCCCDALVDSVSSHTRKGMVSFVTT